MATLSDRLKALGVQVGARNLSPPKALADIYPIEQVVNGQLRPSSQGQVFVTEKVYEGTYQHGQVKLRIEAPLQTIAAWANETRVATSPLDEFAFLDTETSGLAGGTGTYPFLIGVGRFEADDFRLAQFFMRDPGEERAQLAALAEFLQPCAVLVTFNGKSFDAPLVNTRYTVNGHESPLPRMAHLDLLPLARRLWRDRLSSRRLGNLETQILAAARTEADVPGWLIPSIYFNYLRNGDARPLKGVFYHNAMDVLAMAALLNHMAQMLAEPFADTIEHALDLVAMGKLYETLEQFETAARLFEWGMARNDLPEEHYWTTQHRLSFLQKRRNNLAAAVEIWKVAAEGRQIYAHIELAKYHEHKQGNFEAALYWTQAALDVLNAPKASRYERRQWLADLKHRQARLQRRLDRAKNR